MTKKKQSNPIETTSEGIVYIKDELKPFHFEELKKIIEDDRVMPVLLIQDLKNSYNLDTIRNIHDYLYKNSVNVGCLVSGENHLSTVLLLSSEYISYRKAAFDIKFVLDRDKYIMQYSKSKGGGKKINVINDIIISGNPLRSDLILEIYEEGKELRVGDAYNAGLIDNILYLSKDDLKNDKLKLHIIRMVRFETDLYINRMKKIKDYYSDAIMKPN